MSPKSIPKLILSQDQKVKSQEWQVPSHGLQSPNPTSKSQVNVLRMTNKSQVKTKRC